MYRISKEHRSADKSFEEWKTQTEEGRFSTLSLENWQEWEGKKSVFLFFLVNERSTYLKVFNFLFTAGSSS